MYLALTISKIENKWKKAKKSMDNEIEIDACEEIPLTCMWE